MVGIRAFRKGAESVTPTRSVFTPSSFDEITSALGGRASEEIFFGKISTGALNDLEKVTKQAYAMVVYFGLNKEIGNMSFYDSSGQSEYSFQKPYSEKTAEIIDREVRQIIESAYERAKQTILGSKDKVEKLSTLLLDKEVIFREDLEEIFGKRPFEEEEKIKIADLTKQVAALPDNTGQPENNPDPSASA